jgi:hypothetical protein
MKTITNYFVNTISAITVYEEDNFFGYGSG